MLEEKRRRIAANSLYYYSQYIVIPGVPINNEEDCDVFYPDTVMPALHHELLLARLQDVAEGRIFHLMILMPPGSAKSSYASVVFPTWYMGRFANKNIIMATYGSSLAQKFGRKCRAICRSKQFEELYHATLTGDNSAVDDWSITNTSTYMCGGVLSGMTGNRADCLLGHTEIQTIDGIKTIKDIATSAITCYVLSYDSGQIVYRKVIATASKEAAVYYRIRTANGRVVEATGNHRVYTKNGYVRTDMLSPGDCLLSAMPKECAVTGIRCAEEIAGKKPKHILLQTMFDHLRQYSAWVREKGLQALWWATGSHKELLFSGMPSKRKKAAHYKHPAEDLPAVQYRVSASHAHPAAPVLQYGLQESRSCVANDGEKKPWMASWNEFASRAATWCACLPKNAANNIRTRLASLLCVFGKEKTTCPSHEFEPIGQSLGESSDALQGLPHRVAREGTFQTQSDFVDMVECIHEPATVYDIQVEGTECFFANGILVHNCLIIDDPFKNREEADSPVIRDKVWEEYKSSLKTRIKPGGAEILINTRWHEDDLSGRILPKNYDGRTGWVKSQDGEDWYVLNIPAQCEHHDDPLGRKVGEYLWTEWFPVKWWEQTKRSQSIPTPRNWAALYQQRPAPDSGGIFSRDKLKLWPAKKPLPKFEYIVQSWDTAFTDKTENDYNAFGALGIFSLGEGKPFAALLLDFWQLHMQYPELRIKALGEYQTIYGPDDGQRADVVLIEEKGSGIVLCQDLHRAGVPVRKYNPGRADKIQRANAITHLIENGLLYIPESDRTPNKFVSWAEDLINQMCSFPNAAHDDAVDMLVQALSLLRDQRWLNVDPVPEPAEMRPTSNPYTR